MKLTILTKLLLEEGWQTSHSQHAHTLFMYSHKSGSPSLLIPFGSSEQVPIGTFNAILRSARQKKRHENWLSFLLTTHTARVVLEKQDDMLWGRIELPGLLIATRGCSVDCVRDTLRSLLLSQVDQYDSSYRKAIDSMHFNPVYDTTAVWELIKQLKANHIADETGLDIDLLGSFMTGASFPCPDQATRLERSIRELGRQLMQVSIR
ncbi:MULTISPECIES: hypothetical protein [Spirosoma]|uniref:Uncharacterized protein n=1 Tax=Spirosoma sordidisoli TaxID=2502893 RepID=A0A4Q2UUG5_9BACT|nr:MULTISPECIES: hypothetical protein [Spirosoma]RYC71485.1 hypothetical protein EQG79_04905 [Spirosoma sordidisoli]